jgi:hypothetical protein
MLNDHYILVDKKENKIIGRIEKRPENWQNIMGLSNYSDEEIYDLKWAGHENIGFIKFTPINLINYDCPSDTFMLNQTKSKEIVSEKLKELKYKSINYKNSTIKSDKDSFNTLFSIKDKEYVSYKCENGHFKFTSTELNEIFDIMSSQIQKYFDYEMEIHNSINECTSLLEISKLDYAI